MAHSTHQNYQSMKLDLQSMNLNEDIRKISAFCLPKGLEDVHVTAGVKGLGFRDWVLEKDNF